MTRHDRVGGRPSRGGFRGTKAGFRCVMLEEALADQVYRLPDRYLGPWGISFLERLDPPTKNSEWIDERDAMLSKRLAPSSF